MARLHNPTVGLLLTGLLLLQGVHGQESVAVFSSVGGAATLPCHVYSHCTHTSFTEWLYNGNGGPTVSKVSAGKIIADHTPRAERLSLGSDCSLHITDVTTEDAGLYTCRHYQHGGSQYGPDAPVYFSVLSTSGVTERDTDRDETLYCQLHLYSGFKSVFYNRDIRLSWVDDGGTELQTADSQCFLGASPCSIPLNVELSDPNSTHTQRTWRCHVITDRRVQTSVSHTVRVAVKPTRTPEVTRRPASAPPKSTVAPTSTSDMVFPIALSCGLLLLVVVCGVAFLVHKKRTGARASGSTDGGQTQTSTTQGPEAVLYSTVRKSDRVAEGDDNKPSDVTYAKVAHHPQARSSPPNDADSVTYATINITNKT